MQVETTAISLPSDLFEPGPSWKELMASYAIDYCRDGEDSPFDTWIVPAEWQAVIIDGSPDTFETRVRVTRYTNSKVREA